MRNLIRWSAPGALLAAALASSAQAQTLTVNAASGQQAINPDIYGMAFGPGITAPDTTLTAQLQLPSIRWGGDDATRYNWEVDSGNAGFDYYFVGGGNDGTPSGQVDSMIKTYSYSHALVTIPIIPYVNKGAANSCSFRVSVYGPQQQQLSGFLSGDECGNSIQMDGGQLLDTDIPYNHIDNSTTLQQGWVSHLVSTFGTAADGGVPYYQLDNEPGGWSNTHRDVEPTQPNYATIVSLGEQYASAIKAADSTAGVLGPCDFLEWGWVLNAPSSTTLYSGQYYLQQFAAYDATNGSRSLDYFDEHYVVGDSSSPANSFSQVRTWWDPTYNSGSSFEGYLGGAIQAIPRFKSWIATYYPGTKLSISEYELNSTGNALVDALVEADALGVFGFQGLDFAALFGAPAPSTPVAFAFALYRNYDGNGSQFGDTSVTSASSNQGELSVYGALRSKDGALTVIVINKTTAAIQTTLTLSGFATGATAAVFTYSNANLSAIVAGSPVAVTGGNTVSTSFPAYSATELVFTGSATGSGTTGASTSGSGTSGSSTAGSGTSNSGGATTGGSSTGSSASSSSGTSGSATSGSGGTTTGRASTGSSTSSTTGIGGTTGSRTSSSGGATGGSGTGSGEASTSGGATTSSGDRAAVGVGCGCSSSHSTWPNGILFGAVALLLRRRRQRRGTEPVLLRG
jgi:hypothetical protein